MICEKCGARLICCDARPGALVPLACPNPLCGNVEPLVPEERETERLPCLADTTDAGASYQVDEDRRDATNAVHFRADE